MSRDVGRQTRRTVDVSHDIATPLPAGGASEPARSSAALAQAARAAIRPRRTQEPAPLSFAQERLWFLAQMSPEDPTYNSFRAFRLHGAVNERALKQSLTSIQARHDILRTTFPVVDGHPVQRVAPARPLELPVLDLSGVPATVREVALAERLKQEVRRPFILHEEPMLRTLLLRVDEDDHVLLLTLHHIIFDGWSAHLLLRELTALYDAACTGLPATLADLPVQYADFAEWQREVDGGADTERQLAYWKAQFADTMPVLQLPTDRPRPAAQTFTGARARAKIPTELLERLKILGRSERATLFMTLLAAFQVLLHRYTGQDDLVVGVPIAGRTRIEVEPLIGCFVNSLALRADLAGDPTFRELLARTRVCCLGAYAHQALPFERFVEEMYLARDLARSPVFQTMFQLRNLPAHPVQLHDLVVEELDLDPGMAKFDLTLETEERPDGLECVCEYNTALFDSETIDRLLDHYCTLLEAVATDADVSISLLPMLTQAERDHLLIEWNATQSEYPRDRAVHQLFEDQVQRTPEAVAVVDGDRHVTYRDLDRRANRLAHRLRALGVDLETPVGLYMERSLEFVVATLATLKAGGTYLPLDPSYPEARLAFMLDDARVGVLLTVTALHERLPAREAGKDLHALCLDDPSDSLAVEPDDAPTVDVGGERLAYIIYTSGSTGIPKGVAIPHRAVNRLVINTNYVCFGPDDTVAHASNCSFDAATFEIWGALLNGSRLVVVPREVTLVPEDLATFLRTHRISTLFLTTALFNQVAATVPDAFATLRHLLFGGEACDPRWARVIREGGAPERLLHVYGPTESTTFATWHLVEQVESAATTIPIGRPIANTHTYVLDRHRQPVAVGLSGELYLGGDGLARGYLHRPDLTDERFVENPFSSFPDARLYRTGDLVRLRRDGAIEFLGRVDQQVKIRGFRIEPGEVEAILNQHPAVQQAVVTVREDAVGTRVLVAYATVGTRSAPSATALRQYLAERLPPYMVPSAVLVLDALPVTPNGKVDRRALPAPDPAATANEEAIAPRTATEVTLARIWADMLGHDVLDVHAGFFDLGGHSLLATRVMSRIRDTWNVDVPVRTLFEAPTVERLAERIERAREVRQEAILPTIAPRTRQDTAPLSFTQEGFWLLDQLRPGLAAYNVPVAFRLTGRVDRAALAQSLTEIVRRHEVLRATYVLDRGESAQWTRPAAQVEVSLQDLSETTPEREREARALGLAREEFARPFDLAQGPLFRATLVRLGAVDHLLLLTIHHSVFDGWSMGVFNRELAALYAAFSRGKPSPLSDPPLQYADYALWQRTQLDRSVMSPHAEYWTRQLAGAPALLQAPGDRPRPAIQGFRGAHYPIAIPKEIADGLQRLSHREGATLFMTLLAAFQALLLRYTGQEDLVVGSPVAGRTRIETENMIGCFLNILALRTDLSGDPTFLELLRRVREVSLSAFAHQELPFEQVLEAVQPARDTSYNPLVQVMFILQNTPEQPLELADLILQPLEIDNGTTKYDLTLELNETPDGLHGSLQYDLDLFDEATIRRMAGHLKMLLASVERNPGEHVSRLPLLTAEERAQVLVEWNATEAAYPAEIGLVALFEERTRRTPNAVAFICKGEELTFRELNARANQLARHLRSLGVGPEVLVGVCFERSFLLIIALLGILKSNGVYLPLDPDYPNDRLAYMLEDAQAGIVLADQRSLDQLPTHTGQTLCLDRDWESIAGESRDDLDQSSSSADHLAYVLYTSGSTGKPKGVAVEHRQLLNRFAWMWREYPFAQGEVGCQKTSINFVDSLWEIFGPLLQGIPSVIVSAEEMRDTAQLLATLATHRVTRLWVVPSYLRTLLESYPDLQQRLPDLAFWATGGEALTTDLWQLFRERLPASRLVNIYGASEFFDATWYDCDMGANGFALIPIGRPIANMQAYVLDAHLQPAPIGVQGELYIGGIGLARGYIRQSASTDERFISHPFSAQSGQRLYRTGDLARWRADGQLEYLGRRDYQVKVRGFRIELGEIESVLAAHSAVGQAVVVAREIAPGEHELVAYVVPRSPGEAGTSSLTQRDLRTFLAVQLPGYMVPPFMVVMHALPLTPSGKVDRLALPAPQRESPVNAPDALAHSSEVERKMAALWARVLHVNAIGLEDNFFDLGGHSLLAVRLYAEIEKTFGFRLPASLLLRAPTVRALSAGLMDEQSRTHSSSLVAIQASGRHHPLFCVHALGGAVLGYGELARRLGPDYPVYGLQGRGFDGLQEPDDDIVEMAAHYVAEVRSVQPHGPYHLCGLSAGGVIAFEVAQQLHRQGEQVALLAMFDSQSLHYVGKAGSVWLQPRFYFEFARDLRHYVADYIRNRTARQRLSSIRRLGSVLGRRIFRLEVRPEAGNAVRIGSMLFDEWIRERTAELPDHIGKCAMAHATALKRYVPEPYPGHVTVFRSYSQRLVSAHRWDLGWEPLARGGVEVRRVPGNHVTLIREPHVRVLAEHLRTDIARAEFKARSNDHRDLPRSAARRRVAAIAPTAGPSVKG